MNGKKYSKKKKWVALTLSIFLTAPSASRTVSRFTKPRVITTAAHFTKRVSTTDRQDYSLHFNMT